MNEFKINYEDDYKINYIVYRKEYKFFGFIYKWIKVNSYETLEKAEAALQELKQYPKYYSF